LIFFFFFGSFCFGYFCFGSFVLVHLVRRVSVGFGWLGWCLVGCVQYATMHICK
jgi:hypothetical protein